MDLNKENNMNDKKNVDPKITIKSAYWSMAVKFSFFSNFSGYFFILAVFADTVGSVEKIFQIVFFSFSCSFILHYIGTF